MRVDFKHALFLGALAAAASGCAYEEGLIIENLKGQVRIPVEAATRTFVTDDGEVTVTDPALIGPVYLGLFPGIEPANVIEAYPHPEVGPVYLDGIEGNTYPYGGTTIGDFRFGCFEALSCRMVSGRYADWQDIIDWFELIGDPILDGFGREVDNSELFRQTCFDLLDFTSDAETRITAYEDRNGDGELDEQDLDFVLDDAGEYFVGEFTIWQQEMFWDQDAEGCTPGADCPAFSLWGWMDAPSTNEFTFSTCDPEQGFRVNIYDADFIAGRAVIDLLNFPGQRISQGDWVSSESFRWDNIYDEPVLTLDFEVQQ